MNTSTLTAISPPTTVTLDEPIQRGEQRIESLLLRKPTAGELRGISLVELGQLHHPHLNRGRCEPFGISRFTGLGCGNCRFFRPSGTHYCADVEEAMADIAVIFHWPLSEMESWSVEELMQWRERAYQRSGVK